MIRLAAPAFLILILATPPAFGEEEKVRAELLRAVPKPVVTPPRGGPDHGLALVAAEVFLRDDRGRPASGVAIRALHMKYDISHGPAITDEAGKAVIHLPWGRWRFDFLRSRGGAVIGRLETDMIGAGSVRLSLMPERTIRFRQRSGAAAEPDEVRLAFPDLSDSIVAPVEGDRITFDPLFDAPLLVQAAGAGGRRPGFVLRTVLAPDQAVVTIDPSGATEHVFDGRTGRILSPSYRSADPLPLSLDFKTQMRRSVLISGLPRLGLSLGVTSGGASIGFYPRPFDVDGEKRTFKGAPPFAASVGYVVNDSKIFGKRRGSLGIRVFLLEENGLLVRGSSKGAPYRIEWEETLDGKVRASGTMRNWYLERTPVIDRKDLPRLRYRLRVSGPGMDREFDVVPHAQTEAVVEGKVHIRAHPELATNVRQWAAAVNRALLSYEEATTIHRTRVDVKLFSRMPSGTAGFGGNRGASRGFMYLPESRVFGYLGSFEWTKLLGHELGHVQGHGHGRAMGQAGLRAGRRHHANRRGPGRIPMGNRFRPFLEAVTKGEDLPPPDLGPTAEDAIIAWMIRSHGGGEAVEAWRRHRVSWRWHLVRRGHTDAEVEAAIAVHAAGEALVETARLRGHAAERERVLAAAAELKEAAVEGKLAWAADRTRMRAKWSRTDFSKIEDLDAAVESMRGELGSRTARVAAWLAVAKVRGRRADLVAALREAAMGGPALYDETLDQAAAIPVRSSPSRSRRSR